MKNREEKQIIIILNIIIFFIIMILTNNSTIIKNKKYIQKEMTETTEVAQLNKQIDKLNLTHTDYANYVQNCKERIAQAITEKGVETSAEDTIDEIESNIKSIVSNNDMATINILTVHTTTLNTTGYGDNDVFDIQYTTPTNSATNSILVKKDCTVKIKTILMNANTGYEPDVNISIGTTNFSYTANGIYEETISLQANTNIVAQANTMNSRYQSIVLTVTII